MRMLARIAIIGVILFSSELSAKAILIDSIAIPTAELDGNRLGIPSEINALVFAPGDVTEVEALPILYYFHGYSESHESFAQAARQAVIAMNRGELPRFFIVSLSGETPDGGSFWVDSPISGRWESAFIQSVVPYIESHYAVSLSANNRALSGFSMGGFAALNLGFNHPDLFNHVFAMAPGVLRDEDLNLALSSWQGDLGFLRGYARAFAPLADSSDGAILELRAPEADPLREIWLQGFGQFDRRLANYRTKVTEQHRIKVMWGRYDSYEWIPRGCEDLVQQAKELDLNIVAETFGGGHQFDASMARRSLFPFIAEAWVEN